MNSAGSRSPLLRVSRPALEAIAPTLGERFCKQNPHGVRGRQHLRQGRAAPGRSLSALCCVGNPAHAWTNLNEPGGCTLSSAAHPAREGAHTRGGQGSCRARFVRNRESRQQCCPCSGSGHSWAGSSARSRTEWPLLKTILESRLSSAMLRMNSRQIPQGGRTWRRCVAGSLQTATPLLKAYSPVAIMLARAHLSAHKP